MKKPKCPKTISGKHYFKVQRCDEDDAGARRRKYEPSYRRLVCECGLVDDRDKSPIS